MLTTKKLTIAALATAFVAVVNVTAVAQLPAEKQAELDAAGIQSWTPGQGEIEGRPALARVAPRPAPRSLENENTGTMQYDNGVLNALPIIFGRVYGNQFSLGQGGVPLSTITLNDVQFFLLEDDPTDTGFFLQPGSRLNATAFMARTSINVEGLVNSGPSFSSPVLNVVPQSALATTGVFSNTIFLGGWCLNTNTTFPVSNETLGLDTGAGPAGFRGYTTNSGAINAKPIRSKLFNVLLRVNVTAPNTVPVELMAFEVE